MSLKVAIAIVESPQGFALLKRRNGEWSFPGGKVEPGETPAQAAIRETLEESALEVSILSDLGQRFVDDQQRYYYHCCVKAGTLTLHEPDKFLWAGWASAAQVLEAFGDDIFQPVMTLLKQKAEHTNKVA